ncbi:MAG: ribosome rescue protein RqcH, partial [Methanomethylophilus sp.]
LTNARVGKASQVGFDRIVLLEVFKANGEYQLVFEMFGGGNVLLVQNGTIVNCLTQRTFRDRATRPGEPYIVPKERFNPVTAAEPEFGAVFRSSAADTVRTLATVTNLGGQYAEEVCRRAGVDKTVPAKEVGDENVAKLYAALRGIVGQITGEPRPTVFRQGGAIVDIAPVDLHIYDDCEKETVPTVSEAIGRYLAEHDRKTEEELTDPEIEKLKKRVEKQQETVEAYRAEAARLKTHADGLYSDYQKTAELLEVLAAQAPKLTWEKLKTGALKIPYVEDLDAEHGTVTAELGGNTVTLDYRLSVDANASAIYARSKTEGEKGNKAAVALQESLDELDRKQKGFDRKKAADLGKAAPTKHFWFEVFKWFITSGGRLCIAGRDTHSNDSIVKKHLKEPDIYAHADIHGAPSVILKDGLNAAPEEHREACWFALAQSKAWTAGTPEGGAFWTYPDQVSKTPNAGEFVPRGAFIIRGKRNYEYHLPLELGVGEVFYQSERKIMCAPTPLLEKDSDRYYVIRPAKKKNGQLNGELARQFNVPEEEISRIMPPGGYEITKKIWPVETAENEEVTNPSDR